MLEARRIETLNIEWPLVGQALTDTIITNWTKIHRWIILCFLVHLAGDMLLFWSNIMLLIHIKYIIGFPKVRGWLGILDFLGKLTSKDLLRGQKWTPKKTHFGGIYLEVWGCRKPPSKHEGPSLPCAPPLPENNPKFPSIFQAMLQGRVGGVIYKTRRCLQIQRPEQWPVRPTVGCDWSWGWYIYILPRYIREFYIVLRAIFIRCPFVNPSRIWWFMPLTALIFDHL